MSLEADLKRCLSLSGSVSIVLDGRGMWQVNVRTKELSAYKVEVGEDPAAAVAFIASHIEDLDLPSYDLFEAAARRRDGRDGYLASVERSLAPKKPAPTMDAKARAAVEGSQLDFEDIL